MARGCAAPAAARCAVCLVMGVVSCLGWPNLYTDCTEFPELGQPQPRFKGHPAMAFMCEPAEPPASFEWCMGNCTDKVNAKPKVQTCGGIKCLCEEKCMDTPERCAEYPGNKIPGAKFIVDSFPADLAAHPGKTVLLLDGAPPARYTTGTPHTLTVRPAAGAAHETWLLVDASAGTLSRRQGSAGARFSSQCNATRASVRVDRAGSVDLVWTPPLGPPLGPNSVTLRVAAATHMGNISVNAVRVNASGPAQPYRCKDSKCVASTTGLDLPTCQLSCGSA